MQDDFDTAHPKPAGYGVGVVATKPAEAPKNQFVSSQEPINNLSVVAPGEAATSNRLTMPTDDKPVPVVKVLSVRGVEYLFMTLTLFFSAASLVSMLLAVINGNASFDLLAFPLALLLVSLPLFSFFFLRLRKAELANPQLRLEASKRRLSQITQLVTFLISVFTLVFLVNILMASIGGSYEGSMSKAILNALVILVVSGGILLYYWFDEHKLVK